LWAERVDQRRLILRNVPFYAFGVGIEDVVSTRDEDGAWRFDGISIRGGHSTYRIICAANVDRDAFERKWLELEQHGCSYEQATASLRAVDVPPRANIRQVYEVLEAGLREGLWDFEEVFCGHMPSDGRSE
jgi:hypothetical protein